MKCFECNQELVSTGKKAGKDLYSNSNEIQGEGEFEIYLCLNIGCKFYQKILYVDKEGQIHIDFLKF